MISSAGDAQSSARDVKFSAVSVESRVSDKKSKARDFDCIAIDLKSSAGYEIKICIH